ncbi:MAG: riboflavin biosynthesis protein RibF [Betaproteobacteria bacterium RBG_16_64_18]|nr:MAG: riboflavin biosynthesis protein RibF [Betaproteobacteria bacterium RBG_16_64_18]OGA37486.1 MAG: riboflavin biosynthesis protein RibF [Betaproteobacteria bacterium RIFCSPLOWO2_12_FULL_65_110]
MLITRGACAAALPPVALTIGNFDGVHKGHQAILDRLCRAAAARSLVACVLTFEPHPREFFAPQSAPTRLTSLREKLELLGAKGIGRAHVQRFASSFAAMTAEAFVEQVLCRVLAARWILIGDDFRFGTRRAGDVALLRTLGERFGFEVETIPTIEHAGSRVSSSSVREALSAGELGRAEALLGRPYSISGRVVHGSKLGRELGYATANIQLQHNRPPLMGIYAVRVHGVHGADGKPCPARDGVASLGVRPTIKAAGQAVLEVYLFDFDGELYHQHLRVDFLHKIRDEEKYPDLESLRAQIARDCDAARNFLKEH